MNRLGFRPAEALAIWRQLKGKAGDYQIASRPRFGIMRGREFTMKDAYSFDRDAAGAAKSYEAMFAAYKRIFDRFGLQYRAVAADTGAIGGDRSHEFQVIAETGEDAIVYCPTSDYAANIELAEGVALTPTRGAATQALATGLGGTWPIASPPVVKDVSWHSTHAAAKRVCRRISAPR